jgi:hypothetical protein
MVSRRRQHGQAKSYLKNGNHSHAVDLLIIMFSTNQQLNESTEPDY